jgi:hypothetical protein
LESTKIDPGVKELCSIQNIERIDIFDYEYQPIEGNELTVWLKAEIQGTTNVTG